MKSHRVQRMRELSEGVKERNEEAGKSVQKSVRFNTPIGTPASTGKPNYPVTAALWRSIDYTVLGDQGVVIGTDKDYGIYVHQGTYDYNRGRGEFTEAEAREFDSLTDTGDGTGVGVKGMKARAFLVNGLLNDRPNLMRIYSREIRGREV